MLKKNAFYIKFIEKYLATLSLIGHPLGSVISGPICDLLGRRKTMIIIAIPLLISMIMLSFAQSFVVICFGFFLLSFMFGLKDSPTTVYVSEVR